MRKIVLLVSRRSLSSLGRRLDLPGFSNCVFLPLHLFDGFMSCSLNTPLVLNFHQPKHPRFHALCVQQGLLPDWLPETLSAPPSSFSNQLWDFKFFSLPLLPVLSSLPSVEKGRILLDKYRQDTLSGLSSSVLTTRPIPLSLSLELFTPSFGSAFIVRSTISIIH